MQGGHNILNIGTRSDKPTCSKCSGFILSDMKQWYLSDKTFEQLAVARFVLGQQW